MKYLKYYKIFELISAPTAFSTVLKNILSKRIVPSNISKYIDLDPNKFVHVLDYVWKNDKKVEDYSSTELELDTTYRDLEDLLNIEEGTINHIESMCSHYGGYEYYVDNDELNYIDGYLKTETIEQIKKLAFLFGYKKSLKEEERGVSNIKIFFEYLGLDAILNEIKCEISSEHEEAAHQAAAALIKSLPFSMASSSHGKKDLQISFDYKSVIEYIKNNKLENINSIKDLLENIPNSDEFDYSFEYDSTQEYMGDFSEIDKLVSEKIENYVTFPDELFQFLVKNNNVELIKKKKDLAIYTDKYLYWHNYDRTTSTLFGIAKFNENDVLTWFKSYEFQNWLMKSGSLPADKLELYRLLKTENIIDSNILKEYEYLENSLKFGL